MQSNQHYHLDFLKSAFSYDNPFYSVEEVKKWITAQNRKVEVNIRKIPFSALNDWDFYDDHLALRHESGKFFSIDGIRVNTNWGSRQEWEQPIINQPEVGLLGFITREINGILHFLMQAKIEPGNVNFVQLSPTLQATKSNYSRVHRGKTPAFLEYFINASPDQVLVDQLQSEQGARFLKKRNRNIIIKIQDEIEVPDNFIWLTLAQVKALMREDNLVNMDTRTVIAGIPFGEYEPEVTGFFNFLNRNREVDSIPARMLQSLLTSQNALHSFDGILQFVTRLKTQYELKVEKLPLNQLDGWQIGEAEIYHRERKFFRIIAVEVLIGNREVQSWTQPMIEPAQEGLCVFIAKEINGLLHFAVQAKLECGNFDIIEFAPTVQCLTGNYRNEKSMKTLPFLDYVLTVQPEQVIYDTLQSEEGGRFYREQNRNMIILAGDEISQKLPSNYIWMTLHQLQTFIKFNNYINIQARSLLSAINFN